MGLTKADLLQSEDDPAWTGDVPGVGTVSVREITGEDFEFIQGKPGSEPDKRELMARMVVAGLCDESGKPVFSRNETSAANKMKFRKLKALAEAVQNHSGITTEDTDELGNSQTTTRGGPGTD